MLPLVPLCLLFGWMLPADSMVVPFRIPPRGSNQDVPLSFVEDSVDDMYFGCQQEMTRKVWSDYFQEEMRNKKFACAWFEAAECAERTPRVEDQALTKDHIRAICVYTGDRVYDMFNKAVRTQGPVYRTRFGFHSLHFLLTSAIQILNSNNRCHTTYRRTSHTFTGHENQTVRFGTFASSSFYKNLTEFGSQTCFKIQTCSGADLGHYSAYSGEKEVLIPPYETFKVSKKTVGPGKYEGLEDCRVIYELQSAGAASRLNCKAVEP